MERRIPGKGIEYLLYNKLDHLVATQDAVQRAASPQQWTYYKYDAHGREVMSGLLEQNGTRQAVQALVDGYTILWESRLPGGSYSGTSFPLGNGEQVHAYTYYDSYQIPGLPAQYTATAFSGMIHGLPTAARTLVLGTTDYLWSVQYYDDHGRLAREYRQHYLGGGPVSPNNYDRFDHSYSFAAELLQTQRLHYTGAATPSLQLTLLDEYSYDHRGRALDHWNTVDGGTRTLLSRGAYNQVGQLYENRLHSTSSGSSFAGSIAYTYNERGWTLSTSSAHFTQQLRYNLPSAGATPQYNGNISEQHWGHGTTTPSRFVYSYDALDRLTSGISSTSGMSEVLSYDNMGNITSVTRDGGTPISYTYNGNRLTSLSGGISGSYTYDASGNALTDRNGLTYTYNHLNLPKTATKSGTSVSYTYDALGSKLRSVGALAPSQAQDYVLGIEYAGGILERIHTQQGYIQMDGPAPVPHYYLMDHLGNVRSVLTSGGGFAAVQQQDYYPYGMRKALEGPAQNYYLYNGKELQGELGGQYDYGARMLDPVIGRWNVPDPLAEKYYDLSPYAYVANNPIVFVDPDGRQIEPGSQAEWEKQKNAVIAQRDKLQSKIDGLNTKAIEKGWSASKLARKVGNMQDRVDGLNTAVGNLVLEASTQLYSLNSGATQNEVSFDPSTGTIVISYNGTALFTHETTHAGQFETGDIAFDRMSGSTLAQDVYDEVAGYKAQWAYDPKSVGGLKSVNQITPSWVQGITDPSGNQPYRQGGTANTGIAPVNVNSTRDALIRAYPHLRSTLQSLPARSTLRSIVPTIYAK